MTGRVVIDTNVFVSYLIRPPSVPGRAVALALREFQILFSDATWEEAKFVLQRPKFARFISPRLLDPFLDELWLLSERVYIPTPNPIRACRDPRDDKFLEVAIHGRADLIITGDSDLLALNPFQGIEIVTPASFLARDLRRH